MALINFKVATHEGEPINPPLDVTAEYEELGAYSDIPADELPSEDGILKIVNTARKASARASATQTALQNAGLLKSKYSDSPETRLRDMVRIFVSVGNTEDVATQKAKAALGM
jgi:hypothetical protein